MMPKITVKKRVMTMAVSKVMRIKIFFKILKLQKIKKSIN